MNNQIAKQRRCPACRKAELAPAEYTREFKPHGKSIVVPLLTSQCPACGTQASSAAQHAENLVRLKARKSAYDGLLMGEEILALRRRYGITQQAAAKIFGKGKIAFSRYENETSYPDKSTTDLLELAIQMPSVIKSLADKKGVELPLWDARCEDERTVKVRLVADVRKPAAEAERWAKGAAAATASRVAAEAPFWTSVLGAFSRKVEITACNEDRFDMRQEAYA